MSEWLAWLQQLPPSALYSVLGALAFTENVFPPAPADTIIAFGTFLAARGSATLALCLAAVIVGHLVGAATVYVVGRRWGTAKARAFMASHGEGKADALFETWYAKYGFFALLVGRFIPFVRGVIPLAAGAMGISFVAVQLVTFIHAAVWYGLITVLAYKAGENFQLLVTRMQQGGATLGIVAATVACTAAAVWWWRRRRQ